MLNADEVRLVLWYRSLGNLERLAINCWLITGDARLIVWLRIRLFGSQAHYLAEVAASMGVDQFPLHH